MFLGRPVNRRSTFFVLSILLLIFSFACGDHYKPKVFPKATYPKAASYDLPVKLTVRGSTMIFKPQISSDDLSAIANYSMKGRLGIVEIKQMALKKKRLDGRVRQAYQSLDPYLQNAIDPESLEKRQQVGSNLYKYWQSFLSEKGNGKTNTLLQNYCEAKVWQYAFSLDVLKRAKSRPTPSQVCESFYEEKNIMPASSSDCQNQEEEKSFLQCFWREGLLKTGLFQSQFSEESKTMILSWLQPVSADSDISIIEKVLTSRYYNLFRKAALGFKSLSKRRFDKSLGEYPEVKEVFVPAANSSTDANIVAVNGVKTLKGFSIEAIRKSVEVESSECDGLCLVSEDKNVLTMRSALRNLASGALRGKKQPDVNDVLFNNTQVEFSHLNKASFIEIAAKDGLTPIFANTSEQITELQSLIADLDKSTSAISKTAEAIKDTRKKVLDLNNSAAKLINGSKTIAHTFFPFGAKVEFQRMEGYLFVSLAFSEKSKKMLAACLDSQNLTQILCPQAHRGEQYMEMTVTDGAKLLSEKYFRATVDVDNAGDLGFAYVAQPDSSGGAQNTTDLGGFNEIEPKRLDGKQLRLGFQFNQIEGIMHVATVSMAFFDANVDLHTPVYEGGQTLIQN